MSESNLKDFSNSADPIGGHPFVDLLGPSAAANLGGGIVTIPGSICGNMDFQIEGLSTETIGVTISYDGTNYSAALKPFDRTNGVIVSAATLADGKYRLHFEEYGSPIYVKFTKSATTDVAAVAFGAPLADIHF